MNENDVTCIITEDSKTQVHLTLIREFNEKEYKKIYVRRKKAIIRKAIISVAQVLKVVIPTIASISFYNGVTQRLLLERGNMEMGSELIATALIWIWMFLVMDFIIGGDGKCK